MIVQHETLASVSFVPAHTVSVNVAEDDQGNPFTIVRIVPRVDVGRSLTLSISAGMESVVATDGSLTIQPRDQKKVSM